MCDFDLIYLILQFPQLVQQSCSARMIWDSNKVIIYYYYMALSHKDWELKNSRIWLAKMDIDRGLDFPI